jgi:DMSO/TMAO reductase YedYZ heme-binding membrane subunit
MVPATVGHGLTSLWYLTRASGLVALVALTATLVLGIVSSIGWTTERWPRFLSQSIHRNLSLFCLALTGVHIVTTVADGYVPIGLSDAVVPFRTPYRPFWIGLGALSFDLLLAVAITSGLRRHIGVGAWRGVHWLAYVCWPIALLHAVGSGTDTRLPGDLLITVICVVAVVGAVGWRLVSAGSRSPRWRLGLAATGSLVLIGIAVFTLLGPLRPGWSRRAGTSSALLAQLATGQSTSAASGSASSSATTGGGQGANPATSPVPATPFSGALTGTMTSTGPDGSGIERVILSMKVSGPGFPTDGLPLTVTLSGPATGRGVTMTSSAVTFGSQHGAVTFLQNLTIDATVSGSGRSEQLSMQLTLDPASGAITGTVSGAAAAASSGGSGDAR